MSWRFCILPCVRKTFKRGDQMVIPKKVLSCSGVREDFSQFMQFPKREQRLLRQAVALRASSADEARTNQSSKYLRMRKHRRWNSAETGAIIRVKTCRVVERPKQRTQNCKWHHSQKKRRKRRLYGWMKASFRFRNTIQSSCRMAGMNVLTSFTSTPLPTASRRKRS